jgi:hypothetical protein
MWSTWIEKDRPVRRCSSSIMKDNKCFIIKIDIARAGGMYMYPVLAPTKYIDYS